MNKANLETIIKDENPDIDSFLANLAAIDESAFSDEDWESLICTALDEYQIDMRRESRKKVIDALLDYLKENENPNYINAVIECHERFDHLSSHYPAIALYKIMLDTYRKKLCEETITISHAKKISSKWSFDKKLPWYGHYIDALISEYEYHFLPPYNKPSSILSDMKKMLEMDDAGSQRTLLALLVITKIASSKIHKKDRDSIRLGIKMLMAMGVNSKCESLLFDGDGNPISLPKFIMENESGFYAIKDLLTYDESNTLSFSAADQAMFDARVAASNARLRPQSEPKVQEAVVAVPSPAEQLASFDINEAIEKPGQRLNWFGEASKLYFEENYSKPGKMTLEKLKALNAILLKIRSHFNCTSLEAVGVLPIGIFQETSSWLRPRSEEFESLQRAVKDGQINIIFAAMVEYNGRLDAVSDILPEDIKADALLTMIDELASQYKCSKAEVYRTLFDDFQSKIDPYALVAILENNNLSAMGLEGLPTEDQRKMQADTYKHLRHLLSEAPKPIPDDILGWLKLRIDRDDATIHDVILYLTSADPKGLTDEAFLTIANEYLNKSADLQDEAHAQIIDALLLLPQKTAAMFKERMAAAVLMLSNPSREDFISLCKQEPGEANKNLIWHIISADERTAEPKNTDQLKKLKNGLSPRRSMNPFASFFDSKKVEATQKKKDNDMDSKLRK